MEITKETIKYLIDLIEWYDKNSDVRPTKEYPTDKGNYYKDTEDLLNRLKIKL